MGRQFSEHRFQSRSRDDFGHSAARAQHFRNAVRKTLVIANEQNFQWFKFHNATQSTPGARQINSPSWEKIQGWLAAASGLRCRRTDSAFQHHGPKVSCLSETSCQVFSSKLTAAR